MKELKPCPFCGGKAAKGIPWVATADRTFWIECSECGAETAAHDNEKSAAEAWDKRVVK